MRVALATASASASAAAAALRKRMRQLRAGDVEADADASFDLFDPICASCRGVACRCHPACAVYSTPACLLSLSQCVSRVARSHEVRLNSEFFLLSVLLIRCRTRAISHKLQRCGGGCEPLYGYTRIWIYYGWIGLLLHNSPYYKWQFAASRRLSPLQNLFILYYLAPNIRVTVSDSHQQQVDSRSFSFALNILVC